MRVLELVLLGDMLWSITMLRMTWSNPLHLDETADAFTTIMQVQDHKAYVAPFILTTTMEAFDPYMQKHQGEYGGGENGYPGSIPAEAGMSPMGVLGARRVCLCSAELCAFLPDHATFSKRAATPFGVVARRYFT
jgi:hypothetical protein